MRYYLYKVKVIAYILILLCIFVLCIVLGVNLICAQTVKINNKNMSVNNSEQTKEIQSIYPIKEMELTVEYNNAQQVKEYKAGVFQEESIQLISNGVLRQSNITVEQLENALYHDLKKYSFAFVEAEEITGIDAIFLSSLAALESGWATSNVAQEYNNLFGWTLGNGDYKYFNSKSECILYVADYIKTHYLTEGGKYFNGYEIEDINKKYNGRESWENEIKEIYNQIYNRIGENKIE